MGLGESLLHGRPAANIGVAVGVLGEDVEEDVAESGVDVRGFGETGVGGHGDLDLLASLDEELVEVVGLELGDNGEGLAGVESLALAVEVGVAHAVGVVVAAVGVAAAGVAVLGVGAAALVVVTAHVVVVEADLAGVGGQGEGVGVGLPDIDLSTASTEGTDTGAGVGGRGLPAFVVTQATDELEVTGALGVAVTSTVGGTGLVDREAGHATVGLHGNEVEGRVHAAGDGRQIDVKGELVSGEVEHLVAVRSLQEVHTGANVGAVLVVGHEVEGQGIAAGGDTVGALVVGTLDGAGLGTILVAGADISPLVAVVAVLRSADCSRQSQCPAIIYCMGQTYQCGSSASWSQ